MGDEVTPLTTMRQLYDLQELDWEIDRHQAELASVEAGLRNERPLIKARSETAEAEEKLRQIRGRYTRHDQDVQQLQGKVQTLEGRLYSGSIRNPRELEGLQTELRYAKEHAEEGEDALLNLMIELDENEEWVAKSRMDLEQMEKAWEATRASLTKEQAALVERLQGLKAKRQQLTSDIAPPLVTQYEQLRRTCQGQAVAKVERGMCVGCRLTLPTKELQRVRTAREPVVCSSCGRILYVS